MKTFAKTATAAGLLALGLGVSSAQANPLSQLYFSQNAGFLDPVVQFNTGALQEKGFSNPTVTDPGTAGATPPADTFLKYAWEGANTPVESSIEIQSYNDGNSPDAETLSSADLKFTGNLVDGNPDLTPGEFNEGDWWVIDTLTQTNNVLNSLGGSANDPLWILDALANLRIYDDAARTSLVFFDEDSRTRIAFNETRNLDAEDCAGQNPLGTECDDIFTIVGAELDPVSFVLDGYNYSLNFDLIAGDSTDDGALVPGGQSLVQQNQDGTISVFTPEPTSGSGTSSIHVMMSFTATQIPEPGVIGLMSAGILGLGMAARRRRNSKVA